MTRFWAIVCTAIFIAMTGIFSLSKHTNRGQPPPITRITLHCCTATLVIVVWAIIFRQQIVQRRISLRSLFMLTAMLAVWFSAVSYRRPF